jgi:uncharacterized membrane protein YfcA
VEALAVLAAGIGAGTINTIVGSGTLITFPVLLAIGLPPVTANVSNALGLVPGSVTGAIGYRRELAGQRDRLLRLGAVCLIGIRRDRARPDRRGPRPGPRTTPAGPCRPGPPGT